MGKKTIEQIILFSLLSFLLITPIISSSSGGTLTLLLRGENADIKIYNGEQLLYSMNNMVKDTSHSWVNLHIGSYRISASGLTTRETIEKRVVITENQETEVEMNIGGSSMNPSYSLIILFLGVVVFLFYFSLSISRRKKA